MNNDYDEISTGGRVDPEAVAAAEALGCEPEDVKFLGAIDQTKNKADEERRWLTGRAAVRGYRFGHGQHNPARSRCQRKTPQQRLADRKAGPHEQRKAKRRAARTVAWLAAEREWAEAAA